jgi:hypothetical protein
MKATVFVLVATIIAGAATAQSVKLGKYELQPIGVELSLEKLQGRDVARVVKPVENTNADAPTFAKLAGVDFMNGVIEVKLLSRLLKTASEGARGFIGVAFRIAEDNSKFESIYIRPTNGRAEDQIRRNHSTQYFSYPDFPFDRLRKEAPEKYESYADMGLDEWITLRIEVKDMQAKLFVNDAKQPTLIVNDLKHGLSSGGVGLWLDNGTEAFFGEVIIQKR